jgi:hypothetical protein
MSVERGDKQGSKFIFGDTIGKVVVFSPTIEGVATEEGISISPERKRRQTVE